VPTISSVSQPSISAALGLRTQQPDRAGDIRQVASGSAPLPRSALATPRAQPVCHGHQFVAGVQRPGAGEDGHALASIEHIGRGPQAGQVDLLLVLAPERGAQGSLPLTACAAPSVS